MLTEPPPLPMEKCAAKCAPNENLRRSFSFRWRRLRQGEIDHELIWLFVSLTTAALGFAWLHSGLPWPKCPWHALTGFACPTCGFTRCALHFANGEPLAALHFNPLGFIGICGLIAFDLYALVVLIFRLPRLRVNGVSPRTGKWMRALVISGVLVNWAYLIYAKI